MKSKIHEHKKSNSKVVSKNFCIGLLLLFITYHTSAQIVPIPDANFKAKLLQADVTNAIAQSTLSFAPAKIDTNNNGEIEVSEALLITGLNVSNSNIGALTGITAFTNLRKLYCSNNSLATLNVNSLSLLRILDCSHNFLTNLSCQSLNNTVDYLDCSYNNLTTLALPNFYEFLDQGDQTIAANCSHNQLSSISFSPNEQLTSLNMSFNNFTSLVFGQLEVYGSLNLSYNPLVTVNFNNMYLGPASPDPAYGFLYFDFTNVTELYIPFGIATDSTIRNNPNLVHLNLKNAKENFEWYYELDENGEETGNIIYSGIQISGNARLATICCDTNEVSYFSTNYPALQIFTDCTLTNPSTESKPFTLYPNPTSSVVNILASDNQSVIQTTISNLIGQTVLTFKNQTTIDISSLSSGTYFVTVETNFGKATQRVLKE